MIDSLPTNRKQRINCKTKFNTHIQNKEESLKTHSKKMPLIYLALQAKKGLKKTLSREKIFQRKCLLQNQPFLQASSKRSFVSLPNQTPFKEPNWPLENAPTPGFPDIQHKRCLQ